jgi:exopolysaccharide production protein ExoQ
MNPKIKHVSKALLSILVIILILRIASYFMISESATITRIFKVGVRVMLSGLCWMMYRMMRAQRPGLHYFYRQMPALFFYMMYLLLGFASLLWTSSAPYSALQLIMDIECVVFCYYYWKIYLLARETAPEGTHFSFTKELGVATFLITIVFLIGMWVNPDAFYRKTHGGTVARLGGFIINPNELGMLLVVGAACIYRELERVGRKGWHLLALGSLLWALVLTGSRSSMISFFLVTLYFVMIAGSVKMKLATVVAGVAAVPVVIQKIFIKEGDVGEVMSMTGRLPFWSDLLTYGFPKRPFLGFGFMRISEGDKFESLHAYDGAMTHNTFLQVLMNLGLLGAAIVFVQMVCTFWAYATETDKEIRHTFVGIFIPIFVNSLTEFGIFGETNYGIMFYLFLIFSLVMKIKS